MAPPLLVHGRIATTLFFQIVLRKRNAEVTYFFSLTYLQSSAIAPAHLTFSSQGQVARAVPDASRSSKASTVWHKLYHLRWALFPLEKKSMNE